jgi:hypothetical protein
MRRAGRASRRSSAVACLTVAVAMAAAACGTSTTGPEEQVQSAAETLLESCAKLSPNAVLSLLTTAVRRDFVGESSTADGCARVLGLDEPPRVHDLKTALGNAEVTRTSVRGGFATAEIVTGDGDQTELGLEQVRGEWYVD